MHSDYRAADGDHHYVVIVGDLFEVYEFAGKFIEHARLYALAGAALDAVVIQPGALAVAVRSDGEHVLLRVDDEHVDEAVAFARQGHRLHACSVAPHGADVLFGEAYTLAPARSYHYLVAARGEVHGDEFVAFVEPYGYFAVAMDAGKLFDPGLFDESLLGGKGYVAFRPLLYGYERRYLFILGYLNEVDDCPAAGGTGGFGYLVALYGIHLAQRREEQDVVVRGADEHAFDKVLVFGLVGGDAHAAAVLSLVFGERQALDVARMGERNYHLFDGDEVGIFDIAVVDGDFRLSFGGVLALDFEKVCLYNFEHAPFVGEDVLVVGNGGFKGGELFVELIDFEVGQPVQPELRHGGRLALVEDEVCHEFFDAVGLVLCGLAHFDDFVYRSFGNNETAQDVGALFGLGEVEPRPAGDYFLLVLEVVIDELL